MINSLALNKDWDLTLDSNGSLAALTGNDRVAQDAACSVRLFLGEAIFHVDRGVPYLVEILGRAPKDSLIKEYLRRQVLTVPNVVDAEIKSYAFGAADNNDRALRADIQITSNIKEALAAEEAGKERRPIDDFYSLIDVYTAENVYRIRI
jgi:hypothetical protein